MGGLFGGGGGGSYDTSAMANATKEATALQKEIYEKNLALSQPWYKTGVSAVGRLSDLLGLSGGSVKSEADIRAELTPQYTTTTGGGASGSRTSPAAYTLQNFMEAGSAKAALSADDLKLIQTIRPDLLNANTGRGYATDSILGLKGQAANINNFLNNYSAISPSKSTVNQAGLDAAVQAALAKQSADGLPSDYGSLAKSFSMDDFEADPGYAFRLAEGEKALQRNAAAQGKRFTPETAKALLDYGQNSASQEYTNAFNRYNINQDSLFNRLAAMSGVGQSATGQLANAGSQYANNVGNLTTDLANAQTSAAQAKAASNQSMFGNLLNLGTSFLWG